MMQHLPNICVVPASVTVTQSTFVKIVAVNKINITPNVQ